MNAYQFITVFLLCLLGIIRQLVKLNDESKIVTVDFKAFQKRYLFVYFLMTMADWLQGVYIYALYQSKQIHFIPISIYLPIYLSTYHVLYQ